MLRMVDYNEKLISLIMFFAALFMCFPLMLISLYFTYKTLYGNYDYRYFTPHHKMTGYITNLLKYRDRLNAYNSINNNLPIQKISFDIKTNVFSIIGGCGDENNKINKKRMFFLRKSMLWLWLSGSLFVMASAIFAVTDLDVSSPRKDTLVKDRAVANEIKNLGQQVLNETRKIMSHNYDNKTNESEGSIGNIIFRQSNTDEIIDLPMPPTYEIISDSYDFKKWTED